MRCLLLAGPVLAACISGGSGWAQSVEPGRWSFASTEFRGGVAWATGRRSIDPDDADDSAPWVITVACQGEPTIDVHVPGAEPEGDATVTFVIGDLTFDLEAKAAQPAGEPVWLAPLPEELRTALAAGFFMTVTAPGGSVEMGLTGSMRSLNQVMSGCDDPVAEQDTEAEAVAALLVERATKACAPAEARLSDTAVLSRDLNSDGRVDHVLDWAEVTCVGEGVPLIGAGHCDAEQMCDADFYIAPARPPEPPSDIILHAGLALWPNRYVPVETQAPQFNRGIEWRWDGEEFLGSIPYTP